jgi:hypothetical protein
LEVVKIRKKCKSINDVAWPTQKKEALLGLAHHLQKTVRAMKVRDKVKAEVAKVKNRSGLYKIWPSPYPSKERDWLVSTKLHTGDGPSFTRNDKSKMKNCIYLCCER